MSFALLFLLFVYREIFQVNSQTAQRARFQQFAHASRRDICRAPAGALQISIEGAYVIKEMRVEERSMILMWQHYESCCPVVPMIPKVGWRKL